MRHRHSTGPLLRNSCLEPRSSEIVPSRYSTPSTHTGGQSQSGNSHNPRRESCPTHAGTVGSDDGDTPGGEKQNPRYRRSIQTANHKSKCASPRVHFKGGGTDASSSTNSVYVRKLALMHSPPTERPGERTYQREPMTSRTYESSQFDQANYARSRKPGVDTNHGADDFLESNNIKTIDDIKMTFGISDSVYPLQPSPRSFEFKSARHYPQLVSDAGQPPSDPRGTPPTTILVNSDGEDRFLDIANRIENDIQTFIGRNPPRHTSPSTKAFSDDEDLFPNVHSDEIFDHGYGSETDSDNLTVITPFNLLARKSDDQHNASHSSDLSLN